MGLECVKAALDLGGSGDRIASVNRGTVGSGGDNEVRVSLEALREVYIAIMDGDHGGAKAIVDCETLVVAGPIIGEGDGGAACGRKDG